MQRGEDQDYVINYNTAEISFTPRRMITKDSRIQIEFEYADRSYLNTNLYLANETNLNNRLRIRLSAFSNSDAKNSPINQDLNPAQKSFLSKLGDSINHAYYPIATLDTFEAGKVLYKKLDTTYTGALQRDSVFVYSTNPDDAIYSLSFIDVGQGNGDYIPDLSGVNGKVFKWVAPINEIRQGRYVPATLLISPKKQQVASLGFDYALSKNMNISSEFGYSNNDVNTFSRYDKVDNKGYAAKIQLTSSHSLGASAKNFKLVTNAGFEYVDKKFKPLETLRNVEFLRDWGLPYFAPPENEIIYNAGIQLIDARDNSVNYQLVNYNRGDNFKGIRQSVSHYQQVKGWRFNNLASLTNLTSSLEKGYFFRPSIDVSRELVKLRNYQVGSSFSMEHNEMRNKFTDSVSSGSFDFQTLQVYLKSPEKKLNRWGMSWFTRTDKHPSGKELASADRSQNFNLFAELLQNKGTSSG